MTRMKVAGVLALLAIGAAGEAEGQRRPEARERVRVEAARRGWIGITYTAQAGGGRMVVTEVVPRSPAADAGLVEGDTIVSWNGHDDPADAIANASIAAGDTVRFRVRRNGEREREIVVVAGSARDRPLVMARRRGRDVVVVRPGRIADGMRIHMDSMAVHADSLHTRLRVILRDSLGPALQRFERVEMPRFEREVERAAQRMAHGLNFSVGTRAVAGAEFAEINAGLASYFGTDRGALVLRVAPETPAARSGLQAGDVVVSADGHPIEDVRDLREAVSRSDDRDVELVIVRQGARTGLRLSWE